MKKLFNKLYLFEIFLLITTFFFILNYSNFSRIYLSLITTAFSILSCYILKYKKSLSIYKKSVSIMLLIFAIIYLSIFYLSGIYAGFSRSISTLSQKTITNFILPLTLLIFSSEFIRYCFLSYTHYSSSKLSWIMTFISMVNIDILVYLTMFTSIVSYDDYLLILGFVAFSAISCNIFYNYISKRYGPSSIILFRLITTLYAYIIPFIPNVYIFIRACFRVVYPYIMFLIISKTYSKNTFKGFKKSTFWSRIFTCIFIVIMLLCTMLVSCKFKYGMLVIGSGSMTGTVNKGDAVLYERYDDQILTVGQIIVFDNGKMKTVHRIIEIKNIDGELRYFTKGDANQNADEGYITKENLIGISNMKIKYIGWPTLLVRDFFSKL